MLPSLKRLIANLEKNQTLGLQVFLLGRFGGMLLVSILLAKSHWWFSTTLPMADIGQFELFVFLSGLLSFFWVNAFIKAILSYADTSNPNSIKKQMSQIFYLFIGLSLIVGIVAMILYFCNLFYNGSGLFIILSSTIYVLFWTPSMVLEYLFVLQKRQIPLIYSGFLTPLFLVLSVVLGLLMLHSIEGAVLGMVFYSFLRFCATLYILWHPEISYPDWIWIKKYAKFSLPLIVSGLIAESGTYIDGIIVTAMFDEQTFAIFRYGARELPITSILATGLGNAMVPLLAANPSSTESIRQIRFKSQRLLISLIPLSILLMVTSQWLFFHVFNPEFVSSAIVFDIYLLLVLPRLLFPQTIILGLRHNNILIPIAICEIVSNILLSLWLGTIWGIAGIAMGTFISFLIEKILLVTYVYRKFSVWPSEYIPLKTFFPLSIILLFVFIFKHLYPSVFTDLAPIF